jgi:hypothetical protein
MSYSTTATSKFLLEKYSRAYPKSNKSQSQGPDWQHFSNPTLYVVLDKTKSHKGDLESLRMRVLWYINGEGGEENLSAASQPPVIFARRTLAIILDCMRLILTVI